MNNELTKSYTGVIIEESLKDTSILGKVRILATKVEKVTEAHHTPHLAQWTLYTVQIPEDKADEVAEALSKALSTKHNHWYTDFKNSSTHYVIFSGKVFRVDRDQPSQYEEVKKYGLSIGIPEHQLDFSPDIE